MIEKLTAFLARNVRHMDPLSLFDMASLLDLKPLLHYSLRRIRRLDLDQIASLDSFSRLTLSSMYDLVKLDSITAAIVQASSSARRRFGDRVLAWMSANLRQLDAYDSDERRAWVVRFLKRLGWEPHVVEWAGLENSSLASD